MGEDARSVIKLQVECVIFMEIGTEMWSGSSFDVKLNNQKIFLCKSIRESLQSCTLYWSQDVSSLLLLLVAAVHFPTHVSLFGHQKLGLPKALANFSLFVVFQTARGTSSRKWLDPLRGLCASVRRQPTGIPP